MVKRFASSTPTISNHWNFQGGNLLLVFGEVEPLTDGTSKWQEVKIWQAQTLPIDSLDQARWKEHRLQEWMVNFMLILKSVGFHISFLSYTDVSYP